MDSLQPTAGPRVAAKIDSIRECDWQVSWDGTVGAGGIAVIKGMAADATGRRTIDALAVSIRGSSAVCPIVSARANTGTAFIAAVPVDSAPGSHPVLIKARIGGEWVLADSDRTVEVVLRSGPLDGLRHRVEHWLFGFEGIFVDEGSGADRRGEDWSLEPGVMGHIRLWAVDTLSRAPLHSVVARMSDTFVRAVGGFDTPSVAAALGTPNAQHCGFVIPVMAPVVGSDTIRIFAIAQGGDVYGELCTFRVRSRRPLGLDALPMNGAALGAIDTIRVDGTDADPRGPVRVPRGSQVVLEGWALDRRGPRLAAGIELDVAGARAFEGDYCLEGTDVARSLNRPVADCGFRVTVESDRLEPKTYRTSLRVLGARRHEFTELPEVDFIVE